MAAAEETSNATQGGLAQKPEAPRMMKAIALTRFVSDPSELPAALEVVERPVPVPGDNEMLVKMDASVCNPSDLEQLRGGEFYAGGKTLPFVPGLEGTGRVVGAGSGVLPSFFMGKRVAVALNDFSRDGTWAEYCVVSASAAAPLEAHMPIDQSACLIVNPLTAVGLVDLCAARGVTAILQTAALSQVGRMVSSYARSKGMTTVNIVRRQEQADELQELGEKHVIVAGGESFGEDLKQICAAVGVGACIDPVGGVGSRELIAALPLKGSYIVYGSLSGNEPLQVDHGQLVNLGVTLEGFHLKRYLQDTYNTISSLRLLNRVQDLFKRGVLKVKVAQCCTLEDFAPGIPAYTKAMSAGKVVLCISQWAITELITPAPPVPTTVVPVKVTEWQPDNATPVCVRCTAPFSITLRRHHCRVCGKVFCDDCTSGRSYIAEFDQIVRVCVGCKPTLPAAAAAGGASSSSAPAPVGPQDPTAAPTPGEPTVGVHC